ncbi:AAA domain-containing protein [Brevibacillus agri]|uniref:AAA domain-containing protein n=1 Tax=Brevibacillus agri TaxID=51101 RepID=UPI0030F41C10
MDERKVLVLIDQIDKTKEIADYSIRENEDVIHIYFMKRREQPYRYKKNRVTIKTSPRPLKIHHGTVLCGGLPLRNVQEVVQFEDLCKVFFDNQQTGIYKSSAIRVGTAEEAHNQAAQILDYWHDILQYTTTDGKPDLFLQKQFSRLHRIHPDSVLVTYLRRAPIAKSERSAIADIYPFRINLSQKEALEQALASQISIIEGPPGTGKTQTILNILANLVVMKKKTVAVVSGNNAAVQNVKDKLQKYGYGFIAASLGNKDNREAFFRSLPEYPVAGWQSNRQEDEIMGQIKNLSERLKELLTLVNRKAKVGQEIEAYRLEQKHFLFHHEKHNLEEMGRIFYRRQTAETIISFLADEYFTGDRSFRFLQKAKLLFKYGFVHFQKWKENRLEWITRLQMKYYELKLEELEKERSGIQQKLETQSFDELLRQHETYSTLLFKHKLYEKYKTKRKYRGTAKSYQDDWKEFIEHFPIVLSTTHALRSCIPDDYLFDYVIIDEASQVDLLTGALAMSCAKNVIIVGDTKQLPQIVDKNIKAKLKTEAVDEAYDYFQQSLLSSMLAVYGEKVPKAMLKEHYRCRREIIGFCNQQYYNNELIPLKEEENAESPIRLHYTAAGNHMRKVTRGAQTGTFNQREIETVKEEILKELQLQNIPLEDIGFATPYRLQVEEANGILAEQVEIDTVHKYQGREKPIMILSTVLDQTRAGQAGKRFVEDSCLVNVAVSRAQEQFILVTDHALFRKSRKDIGNLIRYIEYSTLHENITQSQLISVFDLLYSEYSERLRDLQSRLSFNSKLKSRFKSEKIIELVLFDLLKEGAYKCFTFCRQVYLKDIFKDTELLGDAEQKYVKNRASFDFVIYDVMNKQPLLAIEVDGFAFHRNNPQQLERDELKNNICRKYQLPLLRLPTTGSDEEKKIRNELDRLLSG